MIEKLLKYQETDAKLKKIEMELSSSEERKKAVSAKKYLDSVEENVNKLDGRSTELNANFENAVNLKAHLEEQGKELMHAVESIEDVTEATYLLKKAEELEGKIKSLSSEIARLSEEIQAVTKEFATIKSTTKAAQAQYAEYGQKYNELKASKKPEMDKIKNELETLSKDIPAELREKYNSKRAAKIFPVVVALSGNNCGNCRMELSMSELSKLKGGEVIECENCRCLLYQK